MPLGPWAVDVLRAAVVGHLPLAGGDFPAAALHASQLHWSSAAGFLHGLREPASDSLLAPWLPSVHSCTVSRLD